MNLNSRPAYYLYSQILFGYLRDFLYDEFISIQVRFSTSTSLLRIFIVLDKIFKIRNNYNDRLSFRKFLQKIRFRSPQIYHQKFNSYSNFRRNSRTEKPQIHMFGIFKIVIKYDEYECRSKVNQNQDYFVRGINIRRGSVVILEIQSQKMTS